MQRVAHTALLHSSSEPSAACSLAMQDRNDIWLRSKQYPGWMAAMAACCLLAVLTTVAAGLHHIRIAVLSRKHW